MADPNLEHSPLTGEHLAQINDALERAKAGEAQITLAERAGLDVADQKAQLERDVEKLRQIKSVYFPGQ